MAKDMKIVLAGFGGQGVLFTGKVIAYAGLIEDKEISWLPSYGPEMRGGTANCSVTLADEPIGSPLVVEPDCLVAMNQPSFDKFIGEMAPGGVVVVDSSMVSVDCKIRDDVTVHAVPATALAESAGLKGFANMVLLGKLLRVLEFCSAETLDAALQKCIPARKAAMLDKNRAAVELGKLMA